MTTFDQALKVFETHEGARLAGQLFRESFGSDFPAPAACRVLDTEIPPENWRQFVAIYTWPDGREECVGFCNWIKYKDVYLEGGLAVRKSFYRRLAKPEFARCTARGGIAQIVMEVAATQLTDCVAWLGYCGDAKALKVDLRVGYVQTEHPYLIVKWMRALSEPEKRAWIDEGIRIGPF
jgi:hypothetical protein